MAFFEVIVGNIGKVYEGDSEAEARTTYDNYKDRSTSHVGNAAGESVSLWLDNEPLEEHTGDDTTDKYDGNDEDETQ